MGCIEKITKATSTFHMEGMFVPPSVMSKLLTTLTAPYKTLSSLKEATKTYCKRLIGIRIISSILTHHTDHYWAQIISSNILLMLLTTLSKKNLKTFVMMLATMALVSC